jgi:hypothetical protein
MILNIGIKYRIKGIFNRILESLPKLKNKNILINYLFFKNNSKIIPLSFM